MLVENDMAIPVGFHHCQGAESYLVAEQPIVTPPDIAAPPILMHFLQCPTFCATRRLKIASYSLCTLKNHGKMEAQFKNK